MEFVIFELFLWAGLIYLFWTLRDNLNQMEAELQKNALVSQGHLAGHHMYARADRLSERIGTYKDQPIYRYAEIQGKQYQFDFVHPSDDDLVLQDRQRYLAPGLVYEECRASAED